ncbi:D-alanyl-D-alanine carboxypeptidase [Methylovirgula sp. 4M-Z18]|uniref:D-alanyl-D-alanine carboxypeptidase family protein n=1 Tax=Methylovirgula sp. 4M-Z18 TaxID=2293567 RepID=UPI000E2ED118|nr:D-alanyl-D-alanine carboxypeptidase family protein [Methylovirgula sp. 4M-Z18]RFB81511.1 D-alanyl-D-alanine carboxypeptidase [Methylovirgula sp. 4M-Z18]
MTFAARAQQTVQTSAPSAILMDYDTGSVLFEKNADDLWTPASTVKVMTAEIVFQALQEGRLHLDDEFSISETAWREGGAPAHASAMFAALNSRVRVEDLIRGLLIDSGNDAAIALAEGIAGSEGTFATLMNRRGRELGLTRSVFTNPWGKDDPDQKVTAREMAQLAAHVIRTYPDYYKYFGEKEFTWNKIHQLNRNPLLTMDLGADGLKTGNIDESGFGLVGSAVQSGQRLILVMYGLKNATDRQNEARKILLWGFRSFEARTLFEAGDEVGSARVYGGASSDVRLVTDQPVKVLVPVGSTEKLTANIVYDGPLVPPVEAGQALAHLRVYRGKIEMVNVPLKTAERVEVGPLQRRALDAGLELGRSLIQKYLYKR